MQALAELSVLSLVSRDFSVSQITYETPRSELVEALAPFIHAKGMRRGTARVTL